MLDIATRRSTTREKHRERGKVLQNRCKHSTHTYVVNVSVHLVIFANAQRMLSQNQVILLPRGRLIQSHLNSTRSFETPGATPESFNPPSEPSLEVHNTSISPPTPKFPQTVWVGLVGWPVSGRGPVC